MQWQKLRGRGGEGAHHMEQEGQAPAIPPGRCTKQATERVAIKRVAMATLQQGCQPETLLHGWGSPVGCWGYWGGGSGKEAPRPAQRSQASRPALSLCRA